MLIAIFQRCGNNIFVDLIIDSAYSYSSYSKFRKQVLIFLAFKMILFTGYLGISTKGKKQKQNCNNENIFSKATSLFFPIFLVSCTIKCISITCVDGSMHNEIICR